ncbi:MAG: YciI family protein [Verrucomicrobiota bacterium]|jgi:hypothetical protein
MNEQNKTPEYMLLFRGTHWDKTLSPEQIQNVMTRWMGWFERLTNQGVVKAGQPLTHEGRIVSGKQGRTVSDGPFAESKEAIAGYFLLQVETLDQAVEIARECPALEYGMTVEVRTVAAQCPTSQRAQQEYAPATA